MLNTFFKNIFFKTIYCKIQLLNLLYNFDKEKLIFKKKDCFIFLMSNYK